ncbi:hypothetical protein HDU86_006164 [Geranomyces michiganensis]|nr:hypothetical protein HDU86_006164 [Geranomyces michiganensis]
MDLPNWSSQLPNELLYKIFAFLDVGDQAVAARACRAWSAGFGQLHDLDLEVSEAIGSVGPETILQQQFKMVKRLSLRHAPEAPAQILGFAERIKQLETVTHLALETTIGLASLLDKNNTPRLQHLTLIESLTAPCSHLYNQADVLHAVFQKGLAFVDLNIPLVMAAEGWADVDVPIVHGLKHLVVRSLHTDSMRDFVHGFIETTQFPDLETLELYSDEAILSNADVGVIRGASCPRLQELTLGGTWIDSADLSAFAKSLSGLKRVRLTACDIPGIQCGAEETLRCMLYYVPSLQHLEMVHNRSRAVAAPPTIYPIRSAHSLTHLVLLGFPGPTNSVTSIVTHAPLEHFRLDNLADDPVLLNSLPQSLAHLDLRFTQRSQQHGIVDSGYATPLRTVGAPPNLTSLSLHNPSLQILVALAAASPSLQSLDLQQLQAESEPIIVLPHAPRVKSLQRLAVHAHGTHAASTALAFVKIFTANANNLKKLKVVATYPFFDSGSSDAEAVESADRSAEVHNLPPLDHTHLHTLHIKGLTVPLAAFPPHWATSLRTLETCIPSIPSADLHGLIIRYSNLRHLTLRVTALPLPRPRNHTAHDDDIVDPASVTLSALHAQQTAECERYADEIQRRAPRIKTCSVNTDDVRRRLRVARRVAGARGAARFFVDQKVATGTLGHIIFAAPLPQMSRANAEASDSDDGAAAASTAAVAVVPSADSRDPAYFHYYAQFVHQQNMLQDTVRTSAYHSAIIVNGPTMFKDKLVMDIGAGSGILSYFAVQAGASKVYAVEASAMSQKIQKMVDRTDRANPWLKDRLEVVAAKIEDVDLPKVDTLISEPIGVLLVHERMIESYLVARDNFLKPGGKMIPSSGSIYLAPFTDANLWTQTMAKVRFWQQNNFYGVDFGPLAQEARDEVFGQPVVGCFDSRILLAPAIAHYVDFETITIADLQNIVIPFEWKVPFTGIIHGIAGWFDINLGGMLLNTGPYTERTHWQQVRFLLKEPLAINAYQTVKGWMRLTVNMSRSYDIVAELVTGETAELSDPTDLAHTEPSPAERETPSGFGKRRGEWELHEQTYMYGAELDYTKPEFLAIYSPETGAAAEVEMTDGTWAAAGDAGESLVGVL